MVFDIFWFVIYLFFIVFNIIVIISIVFIDKKSPQSTFAWVLACIFIPVVGFVFYIFLSQNIASRKIRTLTKRQITEINSNTKEQLTLLNSHKLLKDENEKKWAPLISLNIKYANALLLNNESYGMFFDGEDFFPSLIYDIKNAKTSIDIEMFIIKNDDTAMNIIGLLSKKSREGVKVRLLADATGSRQVLDYVTDITKDNENFDFEIFFPAKIPLFNLRINFRNHRKIIIIDNEISYIGGFNFGDSYVNKNKKYKFWRDTAIRVTGDSVSEFQLRFLMDFNFASERLKMRGAETIADDSLKHRYAKLSAQVVSSGPDSKKEEIKHAYLKMIGLSEESIYIETPYFVPDDLIFESLLIASLSGVDVKIIVPRIKDHPFVHPASRYYLGQLIKYGVKVYFYEKGFLHSKLIICDNEVASVGSANMDIRSFKLNFETNMFIYDRAQVNYLTESFNDDLKDSTEYTFTLYKKRGVVAKVKENVCRLMSDIM